MAHHTQAWAPSLWLPVSSLQSPVTSPSSEMAHAHLGFQSSVSSLQTPVSSLSPDPAPFVHRDGTSWWAAAGSSSSSESGGEAAPIAAPPSRRMPQAQLALAANSTCRPRCDEDGVLGRRQQREHFRNRIRYLKRLQNSAECKQSFREAASNDGGDSLSSLRRVCHKASHADKEARNVLVGTERKETEDDRTVHRLTVGLGARSAVSSGNVDDDEACHCALARPETTGDYWRLENADWRMRTGDWGPSSDGESFL